MADPVYVQCSSACTVTLDVSAPVFNLDDAGAIALTVAIVSVWAIGWIGRVLVRMIRDSDVPGDAES